MWPDGLSEAELRVAALQDDFPVSLCNRVGREGDSSAALDFSGSRSSAIRRHGSSRAGTATNEILLADVDLGDARRSHARRLFLRDRRSGRHGARLSRR